MSKTQSVIVHGPQGCGKTRNAGRIAKALGLDRVVGGWAPGDHTPPKHGALVLTDEAPDMAVARRYQVMTFADAMAKVATRGAH